jgi:hypothetical protein
MTATCKVNSSQWSPEEIHFQHPHLSLAQIHSALAYYYENKNDLDAEIERQSQEAEALKPRLINPTLRHKLLDAKLTRHGGAISNRQ